MSELRGGQYADGAVQQCSEDHRRDAFEGPEMEPCHILILQVTRGEAVEHASRIDSIISRPHYQRHRLGAHLDVNNRFSTELKDGMRPLLRRQRLPPLDQ